MIVDKAALLDVVDRFKDVSLLVIGDLLLDGYIWGKVDRISPEAPVVVVKVTEESKRLGGAGNVAHNLVSLGAQVSICGAVGEDDTGREMRHMFEQLGIDTGGLIVDKARPTTLKTRVIAHAQQVVRVDREITSSLSDADQKEMAGRVSEKLAGAQGLIISDYAKGTICPPLFDALKSADEKGMLGVDKIPVLIDPKAPNFSMYRYASVIKPNRKEAEDASGITIEKREDAVTAGRELLKRWKTERLLITLGEMGMVLVAPEEAGESTVEVDTVARDVYDVSGAGDTVSAVFSLALAAKATPRDAAVLANIAAGVVVGEVGTAAVTVDSLREAVERSN